MDIQNKQALAHWFIRARIAQKTHLRTADRRLRRNKNLGIPVVVLSTIVGTSVFASLATESRSIAIQIIVGLTSIFAAALASLQTFLNLSEKSEQHRIAANRYAKIKHKIESAILRLDDATKGEIAEFVERVQLEWDATNESSPLPDQDIFNEVFRELGGEIHFDYILESNKNK